MEISFFDPARNQGYGKIRNAGENIKPLDLRSKNGI
jgi:hypothetical protein